VWGYTLGTTPGRVREEEEEEGAAAAAAEVLAHMRLAREFAADIAKHEPQLPCCITVCGAVHSGHCTLASKELGRVIGSCTPLWLLSLWLLLSLLLSLSPLPMSALMCGGSTGDIYHMLMLAKAPTLMFAKAALYPACQ
jgi:hypothetical protein